MNNDYTDKDKTLFYGGLASNVSFGLVVENQTLTINRTS